MFPKAPEVEVFAPTTLFAGREASVEVVITAEEATKIDYVDVRLTGHQGWRIGSGKHAVTQRAKYPELVARVREKGELPAGATRVRTSFPLPHDMPPSHSVSPAWAWLELYVRVAIPWWPDGKYKFILPVRRPPPADVERKPYAIRSTATVNEPRLELSLSSTTLIAGESVVGSLAVFHLDDRKPREVDLTFVPSFKLYRGRRYYERRGETLELTVTIPAGGAGTSVPFRFRLPDTITPTFTSYTHELAWWLIAKSGSFFGPRVEVNAPLEIYDASAAARTERLVAAPRLTDERIAGVLAEFATQQGWERVVDEDDPDLILYERPVPSWDRAAILLGYAYRGQAGSFLVARVEYPSLGLALAVTPSSRVREMLSKDIEIDLAAWDRAFHVDARSPVQTQPFLRSAVPSVLQAIESLGPVRSWNDDAIVFERAVSTVRPNELALTSMALDALARALAAVPVESPPGLDVDFGEWQRMAKRFDGEMSPGDLTIEGTCDARPVTIALEFDGETPVRLHARVGDVSAGEDRSVSDSLPIDGHLDTARVRELVTTLRAELARREPDFGPYR
jgi:hypothetical protein